MKLKIHKPLILAESRCLAVATVLNISELSRDSPIASLVKELLSGRAYSELETSYSIYDYIMALTAIYGGIMLFYTCDTLTPISRVYPRTKIDIIKIRYGSRRLNDNLIVKAWSLIYSGREEKGLQMISGPTVSPRGFYWYPGDTYEVLATGIEP
ncbi:MAG: hypothetical protein GSR85_04630 [Desulfurococcales archaeon]|nr:hypothetical protein [Desulfurococcales archaeon]